MRWYQPIEDLTIAAQPFVSDSDELSGFNEWDFREGKFIPDWKQSAWLRCTDPRSDGRADDALRNHLGLPIFSHRLQEALKLQGISGIQFLPIRVFHNDGVELPGYAIANFLNVCSALDLGKSNFEVFGDDYFLPERRGQISAMARPVLDATKILGKEVFRLKEFPIAEFVSERFSLAYEKCRCSGYSFHEVEVSQSK
jgi:hypothetical protein